VPTERPWPGTVAGPGPTVPDAGAVPRAPVHADPIRSRRPAHAARPSPGPPPRGRRAGLRRITPTPPRLGRPAWNRSPGAGHAPTAPFRAPAPSGARARNGAPAGAACSGAT